MKRELAAKANEMRELFQYVTTQTDLFRKISEGIEQLTAEYSLRNILSIPASVSPHNSPLPHNDTE